MDRRIKFTKEQKIVIAKRYLEEGIGCHSLARELAVTGRCRIDWNMQAAVRAGAMEYAVSSFWGNELLHAVPYL